MKKAGLAILLIIVADTLWVGAGVVRTFIAGYPKEAATWSDDGAPSMLQFGYHSLHSASAYGSLAAPSYQAKQAYYPRWARDGARRTPLYVNGYIDRVAPFIERHVLVFGLRHKREMRAVDIETGETMWRVEDLPGDIAGAPLIDLDRKRIYMLTTIWQEHDNENPLLKNWLTPHWIHSVGLDGSGLRTAYIDMGQLLRHEYTDSSVDSQSALQCKTSMGISRSVGPGYVFFGCGPTTARYGAIKGLRGVLVKVGLDGSGDIDAENMQGFTPATPDADPYSGHDAGIWNSGSGPVRLDDGSILIATGNGPYAPERQNFGCSVLRLDGASFALASNDQDGVAYYSNSDGHFNECWGSNVDMASSSVAVLESNSQYYATITGKDGRLRVFDPYRLPGDEPNRKHEIPFANFAWGQPAIWKDRSDVIRVVALGTGLYSGRRGRDFVIGTEESVLRLSGEFEPIDCLGYIPDTGSKSTSPLGIYYSGPRRDDYVAVPTGEQNPDDKIFAQDFTPYKYQFELGQIYQDDTVTPPAGYTFEPLEIYTNLDFGEVESAPPFNATKQAFEARFSSAFAKRIETNGYILVAADTGGCGESNPEGHTRLHLYRRDDGNDTRAVYASFKVTPDYSVSQQWHRTLPDGMTINHSSPVVIQDPDGTGSPLMLFTAYENRGGGVQSYLFVVDADSGEIVDQVPFRGFSKFTMPVVVGKQVFLSTASDGIVLIAGRMAESSAMWRRSVLYQIVQWIHDRWS